LPKRALTSASVERLKPPAEGQIDIFDRGYPGLALRVSYGGAKSFVFFYRIGGGKLKRMTLGTFPAMSLNKARETWRQARQDASEGRDPSNARQRQRGAADFQSVAEEWLRRDQAKNRSHNTVKRILNKDVLPLWGHRSIKEISRRDVLDLIDGIADRGAIGMARQVHSHLHRLFKWCIGRGIIEANPVADLPKPGAAIARDRVLNDAEIVAVWKAAAEVGWPYGPIMQLLLLTAARRDEIGSLRWVEIEQASIELSRDRTKTSEARSIPLSSLARAIVDGLPRIANAEFVFSTTGTTPVSGWSKAKKQIDQHCKIPAWRLHDLRRTASTGMNELGVDPHIVEAVLGHKVRGVAGVYNKAKYEAAKRAALEAWGAHVMALVEGKRPGKVLPMRGKA
jgi:integrase